MSDRKKAISYHEAAHVCMAFRLGGGMLKDDVVYATDTKGLAPICLQLGPENEDHDALVTVAGLLATKVFHVDCLGAGKSSPKSDLACLSGLANKHHGKLTVWVQKAYEILTEPSVKAAIPALAGVLYDRGELRGGEVEKILEPFDLDGKQAAKRAALGRKRIRVVRTRTPPQAPPAPLVMKTARFDTTLDLTSSKSKKTFDVIKDGARIVDYQNVKIAGYLSTFRNVTPEDRDGDYVLPGAFKEGIARFMENPILLLDHSQRVETHAGRFTAVKEDGQGLQIEASLTNSPSELMTHVRTLVAEGNLKTLSMGGRFLYDQSGRGIQRVELFEGSLVSIPSNPDARFNVV